MALAILKIEKMALKEQLRSAREIVVVEDAIYGKRDANGFIPGTDPCMAQKNEQPFLAY